MKVRTDCNKCRRQVYKEAEEAYLKQQYKSFQEMAYSMACFSTAAVLFAMIRRGRKPEYIQKLFEDILFVYEYPDFFGKKISMTEVMEMLRKEYDIDFSRIQLNMETESEFLKGVKEE